MSLQIVAVTTKKDWRDFYRVPFLLHQSDLKWTPPLIFGVKNILSPKNPFFRRGRLQAFIAVRHGQVVGRIVGIINDAHNEFHQENIAFFGFFESLNDANVAGALFGTVEHWAKSQGFSALRGPVSPSTNYECGMQISAFDTQPFLMMAQNPAYYPLLVEGQGYHKAKDLHAFLINGDGSDFHPRLLAKAEALAHDQNVVVRPLNLKNFQQELELMYQTYNDAWEKNWGFVPMEKDEFLYVAKNMKAVLLPQSCYFIEINGEVAAFGIWLPDLNQVLQRIRNGKLFPSGLIKLLWYTRIHNIIKRGRIFTLGVRQKFRHLPLGALLYKKFAEEVPKAGYTFNECSWILEDNKCMLTALRLMKARRYKTYRIYEKLISQ